MQVNGVLGGIRMDNLFKRLYMRIIYSAGVDIDKWSSKPREERTLEDILEYLLKITEYKENEIAKEHKKPYTTDDVENEWKRFVVECMKNILSNYDEIVQENLMNVLVKLFTYRHWGYGFFRAHEEQESYADINSDEENGESTSKKTFKEICQDKTKYKILYLSFVDYCKNFFGTFADNESSIRMICQYYPQQIEFTEEEQLEIASALYLHVSNAGVYGELGYAYNGIEMIEQYIGKLSENIILKLLQCYTFYFFNVDHVRRRQIHAIIMKSCLEEEKKRKYKFFFMDSVAILKSMENLLFREMEQKEQKWNMADWQNKGIGAEKITFFIDENGEEFFLESDLQNTSRKLVGRTKEIVFLISLANQIEIVYRGRNLNEILDVNDGVMNNLMQRSFVEKLETEFLSKVTKNKGISFLYVYLNNYRGLKNQNFSFDNRYHYCAEQKSLVFDKQVKRSFAGFYGVNIRSISCIVGKNGVGKTSFVDFLCESFLYIVSQMDQTDKTLTEIFKDAGIETKTEVLVLFEYSGVPYLITNIKPIKHDKEIQDYQYKRGILTHNRALSKIFYFSGKVDMDKVLEEQGNRKISETKIEKKDYSEMADWRYKFQYQLMSMYNEEKYKECINPCLCNQLFFLRAYSDKELKSLLWKEFDRRELGINKPLYEKCFQRFISGVNIAGEEEELRQLIGDGKVAIQHFSSGQYAKFSFLAKLYWILKGYKKFEQISSLQKMENRFSYEDVIDTNDSALIFIDEGEVYYHPEWQREYINTLIELINENASECNLQIVIATNSPFMLSDIINENIIYIPPNGEEEKTFGQNIHTLLKQNFFMDYTIGEFAREKIVWLMQTMNQRDMSIQRLKETLNSELGIQLQEEEVQTFVQGIIDEIGEEVYRVKLQSLLEHICMKKEEQELKRLRKQREFLDTRIKKLEKEIEQHDTNE